MTPRQILDQAIEVCGTRTELASHLDVSAASVDKWYSRDILPAKHCRVLYRLTDIPLWEMNPDLYDRDLTLSEAWEVNIIHRLRQLVMRQRNPELLQDIINMLDLEVGP